MANKHPNTKGLIRNEDLTPLQRRINTSKAGKASAKAQKERKAIKQYIEIFMSKSLENEKVRKKLIELGIDTNDIDNKMAMVYAQWTEAMKGNTKAFENLLNYSGEKPKENINVSGELNNPFAGMSTDELRKIIDGH